MTIFSRIVSALLPLISVGAVAMGPAWAASAQSVQPSPTIVVEPILSTSSPSSGATETWQGSETNRQQIQTGAQPNRTTGPALAQSDPAYANPAAQNPAPAMARPALWVVGDHDTAIYLFGTVHMLPDDISWLNPSLRRAFLDSDTLVTELKRPDPTDPAVARLILSKARLPAGQNLRAMLSDEERAKYEDALRRLDLNVNTFDGFKPWYAGITVATLPLAKQGYQTEAGVEAVLEQQADSAGRLHRMEYLETLDYQLSLFDSLPMEAQRRYLVEIVGSMDDLKPTLDQMVEKWANGDSEGLAALMNEDLDDPVLAEKLLYQRNRNWAEWIAARLRQPGRVFVAVGAGHLAGSGSVQEELARRGIMVQRVQ